MRRSFAVLAIAAMVLAVMCGVAAAAPRVVLFVQSDVFTDEQGRTDIENYPPVERNVYIAVDGYDSTKTGTLKVTPTRSGRLQYVYDPTNTRTEMKTITSGTAVDLDLFTQEYGMFPETMYAGKKSTGAGTTDDIAYLLSRTQGDPDPAGNMLGFSGAKWELKQGSANLSGTFPTYTTTDEFYKTYPFPMITGGENPEDGYLSAVRWAFISMSDKSGPYKFKATDREMVVDMVELRKYDGTRVLYEPGTRSKAGETLEGVWRLPEVVAGDEIRMIRVRFHFADEEKTEQLVQRSFSFNITDTGNYTFKGGLPDGTPANISEGGGMLVDPADFAKMSGYAVGSLDLGPGHYWLNDSTALAKAQEIDPAITRAGGHMIYREQLEAGKDTKAESYVMPGAYFRYDGKQVTDPKELIILNAPKKGAPATRFVYERTPANFGDGKFTVVDPATNLPVDKMTPRGRYRIIVFIKDNGTGDSDPAVGSVVDATITVAKKGGVVINRDDVKHGTLPSGVTSFDCLSTRDTTPLDIAEMADDPRQIATKIEGGETIATIEPLETITLSVDHSLKWNDTADLTITIEKFSLGRALKSLEKLVFLMKRNKDGDPRKDTWVAHSASLNGTTLTITIKGVGAFFSEAKGTLSVMTAKESGGGSSSGCAAGALAPLALAALALIKRRTR